jgi:hypothetical protein
MLRISSLSFEGGELIVPAITIFEVTKRARVLGAEPAAKRIEAHMRRFRIADLNGDRVRFFRKTGAKK